MSDNYDLHERLNEQSRLWAESPSITVEYKFDIPTELIEEIKAKGFDDAPTRAAKLVAERHFCEQYNRAPKIIAEHRESGTEYQSFRVFCLY